MLASHHHKVVLPTNITTSLPYQADIKFRHTKLHSIFSRKITANGINHAAWTIITFDFNSHPHH